MEDCSAELCGSILITFNKACIINLLYYYRENQCVFVFFSQAAQRTPNVFKKLFYADAMISVSFTVRLVMSFCYWLHFPFCLSFQCKLDMEEGFIACIVTWKFGKLIKRSFTDIKDTGGHRGSPCINIHKVMQHYFRHLSLESMS